MATAGSIHTIAPGTALIDQLMTFRLGAFLLYPPGRLISLGGSQKRVNTVFEVCKMEEEEEDLKRRSDRKDYE